MNYQNLDKTFSVHCASTLSRVHCVPERTRHMLGHMLLNDAVTETFLPWQPLMYTKSHYLRVERSLMRLVFRPTSVHLVPWKVLTSSEPWLSSCLSLRRTFCSNACLMLRWQNGTDIVVYRVYAVLYMLVMLSVCRCDAMPLSRLVLVL